MIEIKDLLKSMKEEKENLLIEKNKETSSGDASILLEFNLRRLNREMNLMCDEYANLMTQNSNIEDKLTNLESNPPRYNSIFILYIFTVICTGDILIFSINLYNNYNCKVFFKYYPFNNISSLPMHEM